jgi:trigger factor
MNVVLESLPNCIAKLSVEVPPDQVGARRKKIAAEFQRHAKLPGYRPGKAPEALIRTRFGKRIEDEMRDDLLRESLNKAIKDKSLRVLHVEKVDGLEVGADDVLRYQATIVTQPEFSLPDYSSIPSDVRRKQVTEADVESALDRLREPHATFEPVEGRPAALGDYIVATYSASLDGRPLAEVIPDAPPQICGRRNAWILLEEDAFLPGFAKPFLGLEAAAETTFPIVLPEDFPIKELAGRTLEFSATLHAINTKSLPELDDALADKIDPGSTADTLRNKIRDRLEATAHYTFESDKRAAAMRHLLAHVDCELPESSVAAEARGLLRQIVSENQARGISDEELQKHEDELVGTAQRSARDRVRGNFLLLRIAEAEKLEVTESDLTSLVMELAYRYEIPVKKLVADLKKRGGIEDLKEQVLTRKALDLLASRVASPDNIPDETVPA